MKIGQAMFRIETMDMDATNISEIEHTLGELTRTQREMMNLMAQSQLQMSQMLTQLLQQHANNGNREPVNNLNHDNTTNKGNIGNRGEISKFECAGTTLGRHYGKSRTGTAEQAGGPVRV